VIGRVPDRHLTVVEKRPRPSASTGPLPDLQGLRAFTVLAEELDVHLAAMRLGMAASRVNRLLKKLEGEMHAVLLRRSHHRIELTTAGERLLPAARAVVDAAARLAPDLHRSPHPACDALSERRPVRLSERPL
jgi:Bacterial regulatory helix-turn-helix protein, lysR family